MPLDRYMTVSMKNMSYKAKKGSAVAMWIHCCERIPKREDRIAENAE